MKNPFIPDPKPVVHKTLADYGVVNRRTARAAGLRNPKGSRPLMAIPKNR